jgi:hypothetical protein
MKNRNQESKRRSIRQYHRNHPWRLNSNGLLVPHDYSEPRELSWWDDVGFILNGCRVMVWWVHPRMKYADAIDDAAWLEVGKSPSSLDDIFGDSCEKLYKRQGRSRKKIIAYRSPPMSEETRAYCDQLNAIKARLSAEGIDLVVRPSLSITTLRWCRGISLCFPFEVRNESDLISLAKIVRKILKDGQSLASLTSHLPTANYQYSREQWLAEAEARQRK